jgi:lysophospholipase-2
MRMRGSCLGLIILFLAFQLSTPSSSDVCSESTTFNDVGGGNPGCESDHGKSQQHSELKNSIGESKQDILNEISEMARLVRDGTTMIINASKKHTATVILSHGLGDTAEGWSDAALEMSRHLPHIKWILPTAPVNPVTLNGGMRMTSWYDIESLSKSRSKQECKGINESRETLQNLIREEHSKGISLSRIVLAGFSQGGAMSLWTGLQLPASFPGRLAGVLVMSGYLPKSHAFEISTHGKDTPVLHCHGTSDPLVLPEFAEDSRKHVLEGGHTAGYELRTYRGLAHSANMQELMDVVQWLDKILPSDV